MNARTLLPAAAAAVAIGVMVLGSPAGLALAAPKDPASLCRARGYIWDDRLGCADKPCSYGDQTYGAGDVVNVKIRTFGVEFLYYCDGFTGQWKRV